jgi:hypothetical protein
MPSAFGFAENPYSLSNLIIASYNITADTYGTPVEVPDGLTCSIEFQADSNVQRGYGAVKRGISVVTHATLAFSSGGVPFALMPILTGSTNNTSSSTPTRVKSMKHRTIGKSLPYFGAIGTAATDDDGTFVVALACCKLDTRPAFGLSGEENNYIMSEAAAKAFYITRGSEYILDHAVFFEDEDDWTDLIPTSGTEFKDVFSLAVV